MSKRSLEIKKRVFFSLRASNKGGVAISNHSVIASPPKAGVAIYPCLRIDKCYLLALKFIL